MTTPAKYRLPPWAAHSLIGGIYLVIFGSSIVKQIRALAVGDTTRGTTPDDYGSIEFVNRLPTWWGEILVAVIVLWLVTQYCRIPREEIGLARRRSSPLPTVCTMAAAVGVVFGAGVVKTAFAAVGTPDLVGGVVDNGWAVPGIISRSLNAGVTEEITLTALPVLLLTRLGWRMPYIVAVSAVLRWPYHLWHGWPSSLPWALVWGAGFVVIYLIWRRLTALIVTHAVVDIVLNLDRLYHLDALLLVVVPVLVTLVMLWRCLSWRRRQRPAGSGFESLPKQAQRFILAQRRGEFIVAPVATAVLALLGAFGIYLSQANLIGPGPAAAISVTVGALCLAAAVSFLGGLLTASYEITNNDHGPVRALRWRRTSRDQRLVLDVVGDGDVQAVVSSLRVGAQPAMVRAAPRSTLGKKLAELGYPPSRPHWLAKHASLIPNEPASGPRP